MQGILQNRKAQKTVNNEQQGGVAGLVAAMEGEFRPKLVEKTDKVKELSPKYENNLSTIRIIVPTVRIPLKCRLRGCHGVAPSSKSQKITLPEGYFN